MVQVPEVPNLKPVEFFGNKSDGVNVSYVQVRLK